MKPRRRSVAVRATRCKKSRKKTRCRKYGCHQGKTISGGGPKSCKVVGGKSFLQKGKTRAMRSPARKDQKEKERMAMLRARKGKKSTSEKGERTRVLVFPVVVLHQVALISSRSSARENAGKRGGKFRCGHEKNI